MFWSSLSPPWAVALRHNLHMATVAILIFLFLVRGYHIEGCFKIATYILPLLLLSRRVLHSDCPPRRFLSHSFLPLLLLSHRVKPQLIRLWHLPIPRFLYDTQYLPLSQWLYCTKYPSFVKKYHFLHMSSTAIRTTEERHHFPLAMPRAWFKHE